MQHAKDFQRRIIETLAPGTKRFPRGCVLLMDMGTGKTFVSIQVIMQRLTEGKRVLVVVPATKVLDWKEEFLKWTDLGENDIHIVDRHSKMDIGRIWVGSYSMVTKMVPGRFRWTHIILDESQSIKDRESQQASMLIPVLKKAEYVLLLTGTIAPNAPWEMYTQLDAIQPGVLGNWLDYIQKYCDATYNPHIKAWNFKGSNRMRRDELHDILNSLSIRARKADVLKLDTKKRYEIRLIMDFKEDKYLKKLYEDIQSKKKLLQSMCRQKNLGKRESSQRDQLVGELVKVSTEAKMDTALSWIKELLEKDDEQLIIFATSIDVMNTIHQYISLKLGLTCFTINAKKNSSPAKRFQLVNDFQKNKYRVAILGLKACNSGINLTPCFRTVYFQFDYVPGTLMQAECRTDRIGAVRQTEHYYLIGDNTYDDNIIEKIKKKDSVLSEIVDSEGSELLFDETTVYELN